MTETKSTVIADVEMKCVKSTIECGNRFLCGPRWAGSRGQSGFVPTHTLLLFGPNIDLCNKLVYLSKNVIK